MWLLRKAVFRHFGTTIRHFSSKKYPNLNIGDSCNVTTIGIDLPSKRNCLNTGIIEQLKGAFRDFDESELSVAVLHGEGGNFCSGFDTDEVLDKGFSLLENAVEDWRLGPLSEKVVICALDGFVVAEGFELALACDLRVIEDTAQLGFLGRRFGIPLSMAGGSRLSALVGQSRALDLIITGRTISGSVAFDWGLAARSVATGTALGQAINLGASIAKFPPNSIRYDKLNMPGFAYTGFYNKRNIEELRSKVDSEVVKNLPKFREGIGKHGKSKNISKLTTPIWEDDEYVIDKSNA